LTTDERAPRRGSAALLYLLAPGKTASDGSGGRLSLLGHTCTESVGVATTVDPVRIATGTSIPSSSGSGLLPGSTSASDVVCLQETKLAEMVRCLARRGAGQRGYANALAGEVAVEGVAIFKVGMETCGRDSEGRASWPRRAVWRLRRGPGAFGYVQRWVPIRHYIQVVGWPVASRLRPEAAIVCGE